MRVFERLYQIAADDEVRRKLNAVLQDMDLRLDKVEGREAVIDAAAQAVTERAITFFQDQVAPKSAELEGLLEDYWAGVPTAAVVESAQRRFLSDTEIADLEGRWTGDQVDAAITAAVATKADAAATTAALALKAPLASPALTGVPTAPTAALGTNTAQIATMAAVKAAIDALLSGAPGALDTLDELAEALGDDPNQITTIITALTKRLRVDADQSFTPAERRQAGKNLDGWETIHNSTVTGSAVAAIDVDLLSSNGYKSYRYTLRPALNNAFAAYTPCVRVSTNGGSSYASGGSDYNNTALYAVHGSGVGQDPLGTASVGFLGTGIAMNALNIPPTLEGAFSPGSLSNWSRGHGTQTAAWSGTHYVSVQTHWQRTVWERITHIRFLGSSFATCFDVGTWLLVEAHR